MVPKIFLLSRGTGCGDLEIRGPFVQGDQILGGHLSRGINFMGIVCPESGGPEVRGSNEFGTKCVAAEFIDDFLKYY